MEIPSSEGAETSSLSTAPTPHATFDDMDLSPEVRQAIVQEMKYAAPMPVQSAAFGPIRAGRDVVVQSRTGTGKTAAFGIPLADRIDPAIRSTQLLVLAPTRELANQVNTELERINRFRGNRCLPIYGGAAFGPQLEGLKAGAQIVAGTPGRMLDHLRRGTLKLKDLRYFILDEADEMLSMGFQDELEAILEFVPKKRQTMLFSATFPPEIKQMIDRYLTDPFEIMLSSGNISVDKITHYYYVTSHMRKPQTLLTVLEYEEPDAALVFCNTREDVNFMGTFLQNRGFDAEVLSGELTQSAREKVMAKIKGGRLQYLVATDVAARGIDINDLSHVINYNLPESPEVYVHRTGRTGRAGKSGTAISIVSGLDISTLYALTRWMKISVEERPIPVESEVQAHKLDKVIKKLVGEVRGKMEEGKFAAGADERSLQLADRVLRQPQAREIVATLLERVLEPAAAPSAMRVAAEAGAKSRADALAAASGPEGVPSVPDPEVSAEQREFEEQQMRKSRGGPRGGPRGSDRPDRGGREGSRGGERGRETRGGRSDSRPPERGSDRPRSDATRPPRSDRDRPAAAPSAPAGEAKTLMVTLGRRQGMGSRDVGLFIVEAAGIEVGQIRDVRVRDGYSFVDVAPEAADKILAAVNGKEHQGRPVKVEVARKQRGDAPDAPATGSAAGDVTKQPPDGEPSA